jgi:prepilin peptidase CpaA
MAWLLDPDMSRAFGDGTFPCPLFFLTIVLVIGSLTDVLAHKIPNWLTFPTMTIAVLYHTATKGLDGFLFGLGGIVVGIACFTIPYLMGGMGAGDAKLMGAVGGVLGPRGTFIAFLFTAIIGGIYALGLLALHGQLKEIAKRYWIILKAFLLTGQFIYIPSPPREKEMRLCYGVAIALGTLISVFSGIGSR